LRSWFNEGFLVRNDIGMLNGSQYPDFIDGVILFLLRQMVKLHFFKSIDLAICNSLGFEHTAISSITYTPII